MHILLCCWNGTIKTHFPLLFSELQESCPSLSHGLFLPSAWIMSALVPAGQDYLRLVSEVTRCVLNTKQFLS